LNIEDSQINTITNLNNMIESSILINYDKMNAFQKSFLGNMDKILNKIDNKSANIHFMKFHMTIFTHQFEVAFFRYQFRLHGYGNYMMNLQFINGKSLTTA